MQPGQIGEAQQLQTAGQVGARTSMNHIAIDEAIERQQSAIDSINSLIEEVQGGGSDKANPTGDVPKCVPSLQNILESSSGRIDTNTDVINERLGHLRSLLF